MNTKSTSTEWLILTPYLLVFSYIALIWHRLPPVIVSHYNLTGQPDGWMPKEKALLVMAGLGLFIYLLLRFLPKLDFSAMVQPAVFQRMRFVMSLLMTVAIGSLFYLATQSGGLQSSQGAMLALISLGIAAVGNYMSILKPNWFIGIRTPWTLQNNRVWTRTHRLGGRLMVAGGLLGALLAVLVPAPYTVGAAVAVLLIVTLVPVVYSYVYFQQETTSQSMR
ncbi:putative membrane protein [Spirosoma oryzae]|uniref:Putative membrane protein n=1 Tax=Spirosoma oryzae TaxID=1469603 RepID=A0A2T0SLC7_9BACT|nr:SdpI family protein [Spirosoma oryzae]PRY34206.1 putative membrane protein [Spirosoma oryzae]